jgi:hypothetical protein
VKKPEGLRRLLIQAVPAVAADPDCLSMFVDKGRIAARAGTTLNLEYRYTLNVLLQNYAGSVDALMVPLLAWITEQQPDLLEGTDPEPFTFESELLDADTADVSIDIQLTEAVRVVPKPEGGFDTTRVDDRNDPDWFEGVCGVSLWQLFLREDLIAQTSAPAFVPPA